MLLALLSLLLFAEPEPASMEEVLDSAEPYRVREPSRKEVRQVGRDLKLRVEGDQALRDRYVELLKLSGRPAVQADIQVLRAEILAVDQDNTAALKTYAERYGWFPRSVWDWRPGWNGWLLVQHADTDPTFQARVLATIAPLVEEGEIGIKNYAYLYDRVAKNHGVRQRYATQGRCTSPGIWEPLPLEEPLKVDSLRNEAGLEPLEDYAVYEAEKCR
ncbi:DUF6624 domain-containing protein [Parvularcula maris]|uniref:Uncharacterized protein n=1 Tax=Parvularcula maris TaxID=2965077 RepID=A0A9X2L8P2_9PROT|nr:DUF6624 domain-containing protein [Parvularcula maris]MCQ8185023.1 hypothetical protein [Parvularcula maris]